MKKLLLVALVVFMLMIPISEAKMNFKCKLKYGKISCDFRGLTCTFKNGNFECSLNEMPFGSVRKKMQIFGTEYYAGQSGRTFLQLIDSDNPVNEALCLIDLYRPNNSVWFNDAAMMYLNGSDGLYYFDFIAPDEDGIYMMTVKCFYIVNCYKDYADYENRIRARSISGDYTDTWNEDGNFRVLGERYVFGSGYTIEVDYGFYDVSLPQNYTGMTIYWVGNWDDSNEMVDIKIYDFCNSSWLTLPNKISINTPTVSNFLSNDTWDIPCLISSDGTVILKFEDTNPSEGRSSRLSTDFLELQTNYLTFGSMETIRGGGEIHVSAPNVVNCGNITEDVREIKTLSLDAYRPLISDQYCKDDSTLIVVRESNITVGSSVYPIIKTEVQKCFWGCDSEANKCRQPPYIVYGTIFLLVVVASLIYISYR